MSLKKFPAGDADPDLVGVSAFVVIDLDGAELATGVVRSAKKVLVDGARLLARSETYSWALLGERYCGASAGINASPDLVERSIAWFSGEVGRTDTTGSIRLRPGKGIPPSAHDNELLQHSIQDALLVESVLAATDVALDGLNHKRVQVEAGTAVSDAVAQRLSEGGATVELVSIDAAAGGSAEALICGSRAGLIDHHLAAALRQQVFVPLGPVPLTARAFAILRNRGATVVADFLSTCGPLFALRAEEKSPEVSVDQNILDREVRQFVIEKAAEFESDSAGVFMAACHSAESFLSTWTDELPFGRPLA